MFGALLPVATSIVGGLVKKAASKGVKKAVQTGGKVLTGTVSGTAAKRGISAITGGFAGGGGAAAVGRVVAGGVAAGAGAAAVERMLGGKPRRRYRRMQVTNMRALDRALRRIDGFQRRVKKAFIVSGDLKPRKRSRCR